MVYYIIYGTNIIMVPPLSLSLLLYLDFNFAVSLPLCAQSNVFWRIKRNLVELRNQVQRVNRMAGKAGEKSLAIVSLATITKFSLYNHSELNKLDVYYNSTLHLFELCNHVFEF
jgi:hypothetical protein